jgi:impB/mucB/samB family
MFATIYLPNCYLQAATRHQSELRAKPVGLIEEQENKPVIIQLNAEAESAGICKGMTPSQALARSLQVVIKVRAPAQEKALAEILLQHAFTLSPYVEATAPGVCTVQFLDGGQGIDGQDAGRPRQAGSLFSRVARVITRLADCDILAQAGIAPLPDTSFLAAHLARPVLESNDAREFLAPLPIETLVIA